jgi:hypothetical protein
MLPSLQTRSAGVISHTEKVPLPSGSGFQAARTSLQLAVCSQTGRHLPPICRVPFPAVGLAGFAETASLPRLTVVANIPSRCALFSAANGWPAGTGELCCQMPHSGVLIVALAAFW